MSYYISILYYMCMCIYIYMCVCVYVCILNLIYCESIYTHHIIHYIDYVSYNHTIYIIYIYTYLDIHIYIFMYTYNYIYTLYIPQTTHESSTNVGQAGPVLRPDPLVPHLRLGTNS